MLPEVAVGMKVVLHVESGCTRFSLSDGPLLACHNVRDDVSPSTDLLVAGAAAFLRNIYINESTLDGPRCCRWER